MSLKKHLLSARSWKHISIFLQNCTLCNAPAKITKSKLFLQKLMKKRLMKNRNQTGRDSGLRSRTRGSSAGHLIALNCYVKLGCSPLYHWASLTMWFKSLGICYLHTSTSQLNLKDKARYMLFPVDGDWRKYWCFLLEFRKRVIPLLIS